MYARLDNDSLIFAPSHLIVGNQNVWNAPAEEYILQGWFPVIYTEAPITEEGYRAEMLWTQNGNEITQTWIVVEEEPSAEEILDILTGGAR